MIHIYVYMFSYDVYTCLHHMWYIVYLICDRWIHRCMAIWINGYMGIWSNVYTDMWVHDM